MKGEKLSDGSYMLLVGRYELEMLYILTSKSRHEDKESFENAKKNSGLRKHISLPDPETAVNVSVDCHDMLRRNGRRIDTNMTLLHLLFFNLQNRLREWRRSEDDKMLCQQWRNVWK